MFDEDEFQLQPALERRKPTSGLESYSDEEGHRPAKRERRPAHPDGYRRNPHTSLYALDSSSRRVDEVIRPLEPPSAPPSDSSSLPAERRYATLESIRRLYQRFAYLAVALAAVMLAYRLVTVVFLGESTSMTELVELCRFALFTVAGTIFVSCTLFGFSEGIQLAIDVQKNTLAESRAYEQRG